MARSSLILQADLRGIAEKLKRADESICNLNAEVAIFLKERPEGGFSEDKQKASQEFVEFHSKRKVPLRFGVLAGEIVHQLRSSLDHIAWTFSSEQYRLDNPTAIAFPVFTEKPKKTRKKDEIASYRRNVEGIKSVDALDLIEQLQPYNAANPSDDPLAILHEFDRIEKHRTLVLVESQWQMGLKIPLRLFTWTIIGLDIDQEILKPTPADQLKLEFSVCVAFPQFGGRKNQPVIPSLTELADKIRVVTGRFSEFKI